ncbi:MAG: hypothetical protein AAGI08_12695 [Bacteroidota bacterium]
MKRFFFTSAVAGLMLFGAGCDSFVQDVEDPIDVIVDELLTTESQVPFLITGVQGRFAEAHDRLTAYSGGLSDELIFDERVPNATFPSFNDMDLGTIEPDNNSVDGVYNGLGEARLFADNLLERIQAITFEDAALQQEAEYIGNLYGGLARYSYGAYFGLEPEQGGSPIGGGAFVGTAELYNQAIDKLNTAAGLAPSDYDRKVVNSLIAKINLYRGDFGAAAAAAANGLVPGDDPFQSLHAVASSNEWFVQAGPGRSQFVVDNRFFEFTQEDPGEAARFPLVEIVGSDSTLFYRQDLYSERSSPIDIVSWQENHLILAEVALRGAGSGDALALVNEVRGASQLAALDGIDLDEIYVERDKELFGTGNRLIDQRRFDRWHLGAGTWRYLPVTQSERNGNENL